jgi:hypothetical protein|tara:strand:+ start:147 stop:326 length:180 start_codon:yes stop_codon:yes gene_type:complete
MKISVEKVRKWEPKGSPKVIKIIQKGHSEHVLFLMDALGCPGGPRDHFLMDIGSIFDGF